MAKKRVTKKNIGKICFVCSKFIDTKKDHYVQLNTLNRSHFPDDYVNFHFQCFVDYFNKKVEDKMRRNIQFMQEKAMTLFNTPMIKHALAQIQGSDIALRMASIPLTRNIDKQMVIQKIQNGRKKRANRKKRKA
jgi:hypothetical protein